MTLALCEPVARQAVREDLALVEATHSLAVAWRSQAEAMRPYAEAPARAFEDCADQLERMVATWADELLTLAQASAASGYSIPHLRRMLKQGDIKDAAANGPPLVRRGAVPIKPGHHIPKERP